MTSINALETFQNKVLQKMTFISHPGTHCTIYKNDLRPELGYFIKYSRKGYYDFSIGDYTILNSFSLSFEHHEELLRFGTVYRGETEFKLEGHEVSSFTPSSFFVVEKNLKGKQSWEKGQHFHGAEITIYKKYFEEVIRPIFEEAIDLDYFISNHTYRYLPLEIASIIQDLGSLAQLGELTPLYLESKILESIALLHREVQASTQNTFSNQFDHGKVMIGKDRYITLTASDADALQKAYDILTKEACHPPTIQQLSTMVFLNEQKLKAGFSAKYHQSISQYTDSIRMSMAENLLSTTELSIEEIAKTVGYHYSGNFVKRFKKVHGKTPLAFRKLNKT